jgi:hypothetical protein
MINGLKFSSAGWVPQVSPLRPEIPSPPPQQESGISIFLSVQKISLARRIIGPEPNKTTNSCPRRRRPAFQRQICPRPVPSVPPLISRFSAKQMIPSMLHKICPKAALKTKKLHPAREAKSPSGGSRTAQPARNMNWILTKTCLGSVHYRRKSSSQRVNAAL